MVENNEEFTGKHMPSIKQPKDNLESDLEKQEEELKRLNQELEESKQTQSTIIS